MIKTLIITVFSFVGYNEPPKMDMYVVQVESVECFYETPMQKPLKKRRTRRNIIKKQ